MKYRKKPVVIEAFQMTRERRSSNEEWPAWMNISWNEKHSAPGSLQPVNYPHSDGTDKLEIVTLEGTHTVSWGDWIIRGVKGELYPCKPDIFAATYEPAEAAKSDIEYVRGDLFSEIERELQEAREDERWLREMLADYEIEFDDHPVARRMALNQFIHSLRDDLSASNAERERLSAEVERLKGSLHDANASLSDLRKFHELQSNEIDELRAKLDAAGKAKGHIDELVAIVKSGGLERHAFYVGRLIGLAQQSLAAIAQKDGPTSGQEAGQKVTAHVMVSKGYGPEIAASQWRTDLEQKCEERNQEHYSSGDDEDRDKDSAYLSNDRYVAVVSVEFEVPESVFKRTRPLIVRGDVAAQPAEQEGGRE